MIVLGIDIGGSGIKGAPVNIMTGQLLAERYRIPTPASAKPNPMIEVIAEISQKFEWKGPIGCGYPGVVRNGCTLTAANVSKKWIEFDAAAQISKKTGCPVVILNDADAAGLAEMSFGAGRDRKGVVLIVTIGTGLGTALFIDGHLLPNTELGHIEIDGKDAEVYATDAARKRDNMSWKEWGNHFNKYLNSLHKLFWPDLIILGGGISDKFDRYRAYLDVPAEIQIAKLLNGAGIIGAALAGATLISGENMAN
jgi:polyphosphate glucokinase